MRRARITRATLAIEPPRRSLYGTGMDAKTGLQGALEDSAHARERAGSSKLRDPKLRDPRLDVFRGLGMFIILIAHIPENKFASWIPARFGYSDAADLFVFCSGMASAFAFASLFEKRGWWLGAARILHRVWQVYWAHIGSFVVVVSIAALMDGARGGDFYVSERLNLAGFFDAGADNLARVATLRIVPDYFDILPMYLVLLAMIPLMMALRSLNRAAPFALMLFLWAAAFVWGVNFIGRPGPDPAWYFNPLGWQLVFFAGFALARGWVPAPPVNAWLIGLCTAFVIACAPISCGAQALCHSGYAASPWLASLNDFLHPLADKTNYDPLRFVHFLATAYLAFAASGPRGSRLHARGFETLRRVGQQTLAVFLAGMALAQILGMLLDVMGSGWAQNVLVNALGLASLVLVARAANWFRKAPWRLPT